MNNGGSAKRPSDDDLRREIDRLRAKNAELQSKLAGRGKPGRGHFPWRSVLMWVLMVLAAVMAIFSPIAVWARAEFLDTAKFVDTVGPLISDDTVAQAVSTEVADRIFTGFALEDRIKGALEDALPDKLDFIAGPVSSGIQSLTQRLTFEVLTSSQFQAVWEKILEVAHSNAVGIIEGDKAIEISSGGEVTLDVTELVNNVRDRLVDAGLTFLEGIPIPQSSRDIVLFSSSQLGAAKQGVELLNTLNWLLPLMALILFAAAVVISEDRRRALMIAAVVLAVAMCISLITLNVAKNALLDQVNNPNNMDAAVVIWNTITGDLVGADAGLLALGIVGALGLALAGPYGWAVWLRRKTGNLFTNRRERRLQGKESSPLGAFIDAHIWGLRVAGAAVLFGVLLILRNPTVTKVIIAVIIYLVYLVVLELLRGRSPERGGAATTGEKTEPGRPEVKEPPPGETGHEVGNKASSAEQEEGAAPEKRVRVGKKKLAPGQNEGAEPASGEEPGSNEVGD